MRRFLSFILIACVVVTFGYDYCRWLERQAYGKYAAGKFPGAISLWQAVEMIPGKRAIAQFNSGTAACRMGNYSSAGNNYRNASVTDDVMLRSKALYNLGTTRIRLAFAQEGAANGSAARFLEEAVKSLQESLLLNPSDDAAIFNLKVARSQLAALQGTGSKTEPEVSSGQGHEQQRAKRSDALQQEKGAAKPGQATDVDQPGAKRRPAAMGREEALRMLDDVRGREVLRTTSPATTGGKETAPPEKDW